MTYNIYIYNIRLFSFEGQAGLRAALEAAVDPREERAQPEELLVYIIVYDTIILC